MMSTGPQTHSLQDLESGHGPRPTSIQVTASKTFVITPLIMWDGAPTPTPTPTPSPKRETYTAPTILPEGQVCDDSTGKGSPNEACTWEEYLRTWGNGNQKSSFLPPSKVRGNLTGRTEFISPATSADLGDFEISADCKMNSSRGQCGFFAGKETEKSDVTTGKYDSQSSGLHEVPLEQVERGGRNIDRHNYRDDEFISALSGIADFLDNVMSVFAHVVGGSQFEESVESSAWNSTTNGQDTIPEPEQQQPRTFGDTLQRWFLPWSDEKKDDIVLPVTGMAPSPLSE